MARNGATYGHHDNLIAELVDGAWSNVNKPISNPDRANFLIVCDYGDWSGFRTLAEATKQIPQNWESRAPGFYRIVER